MLPHKPKRHIRFPLLIPLLMLVTCPALAVDGIDNVFWFRSDRPDANFYTINVDEINTIFEFYSDTWQYRGAAWAAYPTASMAGTKPVYQFSIDSSAGRFFTISEQRKNRILNNRSNWVYEGIAWYAYDFPQVNTLPVYQVSLPGESLLPFYAIESDELRNFLNHSPRARIERIAWYAYPPDQYTDPVPMEPVTGGCFDFQNQRNGMPWVCVDDFQMGRYEVTQALWEAIMGEDPARWFYACDDCPVENVTWHETQDFIERLNQVTNRAYRLPTEAEWEYACRSGGLAQTYCGGEDIDALAWYLANSGGYPHEVGFKAPNGLGLYDMSGNVQEWTCSIYKSNYNGEEQVCDGPQVSVGYRAVRGGSWSQDAGASTSTYRMGLTPANRSPSIGLRLAHD